MASRFEDMLEHREVIVYRAPRRWAPNTAGLTFIGYAVPIAIAAGSGLLRFDPIGLASLAAALSGVLIYTLHYTLRDASREAVVTDRRLLLRTGWRRPVTSEVRIKDVCRIQVSWDRLRLSRRDGRCLVLGHPQHARGLGVALAHAALLPLPRPTPEREVFADALWQVCGMTAGILAAVVTLRHYSADFIGAAASYGWWLSATGFFLAGWFLHALGLVLGGNIALIPLRLFLTYDQMRAWMENSELSWPLADGKPAVDDQDDWGWRLIDLLYGRRPAARSGPGRI